MIVAPKTIAPGIIITWLSGMCPVQAEGTIDGVPFFFHARHTTLSLCIDQEGRVHHPTWEWCETFLGGGDAGAGYISDEHAIAVIAAFGKKYQDGMKQNGPAFHKAARRQRLLRFREEHPELKLTIDELFGEES